MNSASALSRRQFVGAAAGLALGGMTSRAAAGPEADERVIDIHQHTDYSGRTDAELIAHQRALGVTTSILLPAGRFYGLDAHCGGNETVARLARAHPQSFKFFANEVADLPEARTVIKHWLRRGAIGIGEQKFRVAGDSRYIESLAELARDFDVPMLLHIQHDRYNTGIENFHRTLEKFPQVNFIGHAQTWWANVDKNHLQPVLYPKGKVTPGGLTDRLLSDYPNMFGDLSAGSGLNFFTRDEDHARWFIEKHQDKLIYGSDCDDRTGSGASCQGAQTLAMVRKLAATKRAERKILHDNAGRLLKL